MSSTAITFFKANSAGRSKGFLTRKNITLPVFAVLGVSLAGALAAYFILTARTISMENAVQNDYMQIAKLDEENGMLETQIANYDKVLQSDEQLVKMELVKNNLITYLERTSGGLVVVAPTPVRP